MEVRSNEGNVYTHVELLDKVVRFRLPSQLVSANVVFLMVCIRVRAHVRVRVHVHVRVRVHVHIRVRVRMRAYQVWNLQG